MTKEVRIAVAAGLPMLALYLVFVAPGVSVGDSAEFITNAYTLGINHTTGYPLYTVLGRVAILILSFLTPAKAVNIFSACAAAGSVAVIAQLLMLVAVRPSLAWVGAIFVGLSLTLWSHAEIAEVYALNVLALALVLFLCLRWEANERPWDRPAFLIAFVTGIGLTHHVTGVLAIPAVAVFVFTSPNVRSWRRRAALIGMFALGASISLYLPLRSAVDPPVDWLDPESPRKLLGFFFPFAGRKVFGMPLPDLWERSVWVLDRLLTKEYWYFAAVGVFGVAALWDRRRVALLLLSIAVLDAAYCTVRRQPTFGDLDAALLPAILVLGILCVVGLQDLVDRWPHFPRFAAPAAMIAASVVLAVLHAPACDRRNDRLAEYLVQDLLGPVAPNAIVFVVGDEQTFLPWYEKYVTRRFSKITVVNWTMLGADWHAEAVSRELGMNLLAVRSGEGRTRMIMQNFAGRRPMAFTNEVPWDWVYREHATSVRRLAVLLDDSLQGRPCFEPFFAMDSANISTPDDRTRFTLTYYPKTLLVNARKFRDLGRFDEALCLLRSDLKFLPSAERDDYRSEAARLRQEIVEAKRGTGK